MLLHTTVPSYPLHLLLRPACLGNGREALAQAPEQCSDRPGPAISPAPTTRPAPPVPPPN